MNNYVYSLDAFGRMMGDYPRMSAYEKAIARAVRPGDAVLDLGCGPGIMAMLACQVGARRVYAVDTNPVVDIGRQLAAKNGFRDRIEFILGDSRQIELPERVKVIVSDIRGVVPLHGHAVRTLNDARERFLAPGGRMIPTRDVLMAAVVSATEHYEELLKPWQRQGLDFSAVMPLLLNSAYRARIGTQRMLSSSHAWFSLDYAHGASERAAADFELTIEQEGVGHGLSIWFEATLYEDIGYSTHPEYHENISGRRFLPWLAPVSLRSGDEVHVSLRADLVGSDYIWRWDTRIPGGRSRKETVFRQSSFLGGAFFASDLQKRASACRPQLSAEGEAECWLFQSMSGERSLQEIAEEATRLFPTVFRRVEDAFTRAADIAEKFAL
jgi:protein arginine N-methyltransferase 1